MATRVVKEDDVPWALDALDPNCQLLRVGGLDISFQQEPAAHDINGACEGDRTRPPDGGECNLPDTCLSSDLPTASDPPTAALGNGPGGTGPGVAALVVLSFPDLKVLYEDYEPVDLTLPYLPGYLGFREAAAYGVLLDRAASSPHEPQVLLVDGCGVLHPRGCGSACQVGVTCGVPSVGVAKNLLAVDGLDRGAVRAQLQDLQEAAAAAEAEAEAERRRAQGPEVAAAVSQLEAAGRKADAAAAESEPALVTAEAVSPAMTDSQQHHNHNHQQQQQQQRQEELEQPLRDAGSPRPVISFHRVAAAGPARDVCVPLRGVSGRVYGTALCPGNNRRPLYISVGHRLSLPTAVELVRRCCRHRIPEPIRQADLRSREWLRKQKQQHESGGVKPRTAPSAGNTTHDTAPDG